MFRAPNAMNEAMDMVNRGGRICLAAFREPVPVDLAKLACNNIHVFSAPGRKAQRYTPPRL
jgi:hypothetical protein